MIFRKILCASMVLALFACNGNKKSEPVLLDKAAFDTEVDGKPVSLYTLDSGNGLKVQVTNYGLRVVSIWTADKDGSYADVAVGYESIARYLDNKGERFMGPVVGRYANRIAKGQFQLDGVTYNLPINNNGQTLHGGLKGFDMVAWDVKEATDKSVHFSYVSVDGEEGFPGTVNVDVIYSVTPDNGFKIAYKATTDKPTVINLSNHAFFNLKGDGGGTITDNILTINASATTPVDSVLIPSGEITSVEGTPFDFRTPIAIGARINIDDAQLKNGLGYDHNWVLDRKTDNEVELAVTLYEPASGRVMEVYTDQPGLQFYSGNFFDGSATSKYGKAIGFREALALETQKFPDSPNHPNFPSTRLNPGETYTHTCIYKFSSK